MNVGIVKEIVQDIVVTKITNLLDDMSSNEFFEEVLDVYHERTKVEIETDEDEEVIKSVIGEVVSPLVNMIVNQYILEHHVMKK